MELLHSQDSWQILVALLWPPVQEYMKNSQAKMFSWIGTETKALNRLISPAVALLATLGLHFTWVPPTHDTAGLFSIMIPPLAIVGHAAGQWAVQHFEYTLGIKYPALLKAILTELQQMNGAK